MKSLIEERYEKKCSNTKLISFVIKWFEVSK